MLLLGIDIGTSSIKVSVVDAATRECIGSAKYPETESNLKILTDLCLNSAQNKKNLHL